MVYEESVRKEVLQVNVVYFSFMLRNIEKVCEAVVDSISSFFRVCFLARMVLQFAGLKPNWLKHKMNECLNEYAKLRTQSDKAEYLTNCTYEILDKTLDDLAPFIESIAMKVRNVMEEVWE